MSITYTVACRDYETKPHKTYETAVATRDHFNSRDSLCTNRGTHHIHSIIDGTQAPCVTCEPVLPNFKKGDGHTACCDALTTYTDGVEHCKACYRPITGRL